MEPSVIIYLATAAAIVGLMIWGRLEWHAALCLGFVGPFVGVMLSLPLGMFLNLLYGGIAGGNAAVHALGAQVLLLVGVWFLARSRRRSMGIPASEPKEVSGNPSDRDDN